MPADAVTRGTVSSATEESTAPTRPGRRLVRAFMRHRLAVGGLFILGVLGLAAIFAPVVATHDPYTVDLLAAGEGPSTAHWLGTDEVGRDVFSRLVYGA
ncbi:MAG TPA: hypothetical protein VD789_09915, partial [Thermomicrobiales bacterium]|nr:hypothetical protein [Thermomicrobiales bacterium]